MDDFCWLDWGELVAAQEEEECEEEQAQEVEP